jgi:4-oxalocrotonate tautomerase
MEKTLGGRSLDRSQMWNAECGMQNKNSEIRNPNSELGRKEISMPIVQISLLPGRTPEKKEELIKNVTNAIADTLQIPKERVHIVLNEVPKENIGRGGVPLSKMDL